VALPLYDNQPTRRAPLVTYLLIAANVVIFLLSPVASIGHQNETDNQRKCEQVTFLLKYGAIPKEMINNRQEPMPQEITDACHPRPFHKRPWFSALSSMFLHGGVTHILFNMIYLFVFGAATEDRLGRLRFLGFYLLAGFVAAYGFALTYPGSLTPLVGASGAIAGVLGSHLVLYPRSRHRGRAGLPPGAVSPVEDDHAGPALHPVPAAVVGAAGAVLRAPVVQPGRPEPDGVRRAHLRLRGRHDLRPARAARRLRPQVGGTELAVIHAGLGFRHSPEAVATHRRRTS
jgi:membrane associated rhomboid family serine protease